MPDIIRGGMTENQVSAPKNSWSREETRGNKTAGALKIRRCATVNKKVGD